MDDDGVVDIVSVYEVGGGDTCRDPLGVCVTVARRDADEAVGREHHAVVGDRQILDPLWRSSDGAAGPREPARGYLTCA